MDMDMDEVMNMDMVKPEKYDMFSQYLYRNRKWLNGCQRLL